ncbi:malonyl-CoA:anthocyanidin 5-O-glucoside-6''-O-malonyltransferase-like [Prosopis cineraria]|uniref:malonyl-CoA:anthocyanidin 5-O-glucoside-6''-O-malonyltransferase-like n=1 Tax=Prosopis cineraria TaxID=364024 RepID=UPI00241072AF|nr:malonyl-CoA:anthocyanidin 5-O-glucoside-6''-O-malonyltransferase-like [Prosopis cineraria]
MASSNPSLKIHELCRIAPPPSSPKSSFSLSFFDLLWLRFHPVERLFCFSVPHLKSSSFFDSIVPKLKRSLSLALQHFLPFAGNIVWPSDSDSVKPIVRYTPGDAVSLTIAVSDSDFSHFLDNSPRDASESRAFVPNLDSSDSSASVLSLQITLFPNSGFCIGITAHHACSDGKSSSMFIKAWAYLCRITEADAESESSSGLLPPELQPFLDREVILDPRGIASAYINGWTWSSSGLDPNDQTQKNRPSLKILSEVFPPKVDDSDRAIFDLRRGVLEKIKGRVLQKWESLDKVKEEITVESLALSKPQTLSTFVLTTAYVWVCFAKAMEKIAEQKTKKVLLGFVVDCRNRLEPPIPENYFGNCVMSQVTETLPENLTNEDGIVIAAKKVYGKIMKMQKENGVLDGAETLFSTFSYVKDEENRAICIGVAGSTRFGVYGVDFGWGRPEKVEITSVDRNITMAMAESKDGNGGVEVGLVLKKNVMEQFALLFRSEIESI